MNRNLKKGTFLITGCSGLLGSNICNRLLDHDVIGLYHRHDPVIPIRRFTRVDITKENDVSRCLDEFDPDVVIHCAGMTSVDACEKDFDRAMSVNADGTLNLVKHTNKKAKFVYISTDAVFDGKEGNYSEDDTPVPINTYGKSKLNGERHVTATTDNSLVIRTNFYGFAPEHRKGFVQWILGELVKEAPICLATDWYYSPVLVNELVDAIIELIRSDARGIFHISSTDSCSKYDFALEVAEHTGLDASLIQPITLDDLKLQAPRPQNMTLDCSKILKEYAVELSGYRAGIKKFVTLFDEDYSGGRLKSGLFN